MNPITEDQNLITLNRAAERLEDYDIEYRGQGLVQITNRAEPARSYSVSRYRCECPDDRYRGHERPCFHRQMAMAYLSIRPEEAPEVRSARAKADREALWS
jgi:hypothetical protein